MPNKKGVPLPFWPKNKKKQFALIKGKTKTLKKLIIRKNFTSRKRKDNKRQCHKKEGTTKKMEKKKVNESQKGLEVSSFLGFQCGQHTWPEIVTQRREKRENWGNGTRKPTETATTKGPTSDWKGSLGQNGLPVPAVCPFVR